MLLDNDTVVGNGSFATTLLVLCLEFFDTILVLILPQIIYLTVHRLCSITKDTKDHCSWRMGLCSVQSE